MRTDAKTSTNKTLKLLRDFESRNVTFQAEDGCWPMVWERARGMHVWDPEERRYLDLTAAFGVAAAGHANRMVVQAGQAQMARLLHAMGDVHPHAQKAELAAALSALTFQRWGRGTRARRSSARGKTIFCNSGFEAVEAALKTALLATDKPGVIAFENGYHGLGYGALNATHRSHFRGPFLRQLREFGSFVRFPVARASDRTKPAQLAVTCKNIEQLLKAGTMGAVLVEPIQVRGGINLPTPGFLRKLRDLCDRFGALLILDEIYTGFGRTGRWFACEHEAVVPDLICLGKALTGGFPLAACVGRADLMDRAWPPSTGEAIHTSTFLGHPVGCAMARAQIKEIKRLGLPERSKRTGAFLLRALGALCHRIRPKTPGIRYDVRGIGLLAGLELRLANGEPATQFALECIAGMLKRGFILLPEGEHANVIALTPPLIVSRRQLTTCLSALGEVLVSIAPAFRSAST